MNKRKYIVYSFQYAEMKKPSIDAKCFTEKKVWDTLPPTLIEYVYVYASNKKEAIELGKEKLLSHPSFEIKSFKDEGSFFSEIENIKRKKPSVGNTSQLGTLINNLKKYNEQLSKVGNQSPKIPDIEKVIKTKLPVRYQKAVQNFIIRINDAMALNDDIIKYLEGFQ